jgi:hypothetical protein
MMLLHSWLRTLQTAFNFHGTEGRRGRMPHRKQPARYQPRLEVLEDRLAPAAYLVTSVDDNLAPIIAGTGTEEDPFLAPSLRSALLAAETDVAADTTILLTQGEIGVFGGGPITIDGSTPGGRVTLSGNNASRIFHFGDSVTLELDNLNLINGLADEGGAIRNRGNLWIDGCTLSGNTATNRGGAIMNWKNLRISDSTISGNIAHDGGGLFHAAPAHSSANVRGTLEITNNSILTDNHATRSGGGIYSTPAGDPVDVIITESTLSQNTAAIDGGGIYVRGSFAGGTSMIESTLTMSGSTLSQNSAGGNGGGIYGVFSKITINATSTLSQNSARHGGGLYTSDNPFFLDGRSIQLSNTTLTGNRATGNGGGIVSDGTQLTISGGMLTGNSAVDSGGGVYISFLGSATISGAPVSGNSANIGGGIFNAGALRIEDNSSVVTNHAPIAPNLGNEGQLVIVNSIIGSLTFAGQAYANARVTFFASSAFAQASATLISHVAAPTRNVYDYDEEGNEIVIGQVPVPITITLNLSQGKYGDLVLSTQENVTLVVKGVENSVGTVNGTEVVGNSPALVVTGGNVIIRDVAFTTATDSPTIIVTGGNLTLANTIVEESTVYNNVAIKITDGWLDLGTAESPGGNTIQISGDGQFVFSTGSSVVTTVGTAFEIDGVTLPIDQIANLIIQVGTLNLSSSQKTSLTSKLQAAQQSLASANTTAAASQLSAFINQLNALVNSHRLGEIDAGSLTDEVDNLLELIG